MLRIIEGGFNSGISEHIVKEIHARLLRGERSLLIVPEQQTVIAEAETCEALPESAPLFFEVTNFTRLANSVFRALGGISGEYCTSDKKSLIMWRTLSELAPTLAMTGGRSEISVGLISRATAALRLAESHGIGPEELSRAAESEEVSSDARLSSKVNDLAVIMALYKKLLTEKYQDASDDLSETVKRLAASPSYLSDTVIFVEGFTSFTAPQYALLRELLGRTEVCVALNIPKASSASYEFAEPRETKDRLIAIADRLGVSKKSVKLDGAFGVSPILSETEGLLFRTEGTLSETPLGETLRVVEANDPFDECLFVASDIKRRVIGGAKYSDFAVIARSAEKYAGILDVTLRDYSIPYFASYRRPISSYEAIKFIHTAYAAITGGFKREDVITYAKCGLTDVSDDALDELELYCDKWQITGRGFSDSMPWNMNPRGYEEVCDSEKLRRINETRDALMLPLIAFSEDVRAARTVKEHAAALLSFLLSMKIEDKLFERAEALANSGEQGSADMLRIWGMICESLDSIVSALGETEADADAFRLHLGVVFNDKTVGSIPSYLDVVTVGSADMLRLKNKNHVYLIGVNAGEFPASVSEDNYFTDRDKEALSRAGVSFDGSTVVKSARELYSFRRAFSFASESVTVSYSAASTKQKHLSPSDLIARIGEITGERIKPLKTSELASKDFVYTPSSAILKLTREDSVTNRAIRLALERAGLSRLSVIASGSIVNDALALSPEVCAEAFSRDLALTQSRIDTYVACPLMYFCKYELKLSDNERAEWSANNVGTFVHAILENFFRAVRDGKLNAGTLDESAKRDMTREAARKYLASLFPDGLIGGARFEIMLSRLERASLPVVDGLCDEFSNCKFLPRFFELKIQRDDPKSPAPVTFRAEDGRSVYVYGTIDRVDTYSQDGDVYVRVIDYKTGTKQFSPADLAEGKNLQMFLYLKSIVDTASPEFLREVGTGEGGRLIPAGVIYAHTTVEDTKVKTEDAAVEKSEIAKSQKRSGMILSDEKSVSAMNKNYLPVTFDKSGEMKPDRLYTEEGWERMTKTIEESVLRVASGIRSGCASAPKKDGADRKSCDWCEYKAICRNASI